MSDPRLEALVEKLTDAELEAVTLCFIQGHGIRGAARRLNVSPQAVRDRLEGVRRKARSLPKATEAEGRSLAVTEGVSSRSSPTYSGTGQAGPESGRYRGTGLAELDQWIAQRDARDVMVDEVTPDNDPSRPTAGATLAGDERRLRGIPVIGRGVGGASPGTKPGA